MSLILALGSPWRASAQQPPDAPATPAPSPGRETVPPRLGPATAPEQPVPAVPPPVVPVPEVKPRPPRPDEVFSGHPVSPSDEEQAQEHAWFDSGRSFVGRLFFAPVVSLDRFFSDETELDPERARSFARLRLGLQIRQDGKPIWSPDLLAQVYLPGMEEWLDRFRLVLTGVTDSTDENVTSESGTTAPLSRFRSEPANLELRFGAYRGIRSSMDLGAGILFRLPPGAQARVRYRLAVPIDDIMVARLSSQVFWRTDMHLGARLTPALEWPATPSSMVRLSGTSQVAQLRTNGIEYGAQLVYSHAFTPTAAVALGGDTLGATGSPVAFDKYRVFARFRHDVLRRWLFFEVEPEVGWPWTRLRGRYRALAATLRLEVQFEGAGAAGAAR